MVGGFWRGWGLRGWEEVEGWGEVEGFRVRDGDGEGCGGCDGVVG